MDINKEVKQLAGVADEIAYIISQARKIDNLLKIVVDLQKRILILEKNQKALTTLKAKSDVKEKKKPISKSNK